MLLSMTGYGEARRQEDDITVAVEVRTVNNRYFKLSLRVSEGYNGLETEVEALVRRHVRRGTVNVNLQIERQPSADDYCLNELALDSYRRQLEGFIQKWQLAAPPSLDALLPLPGVVEEAGATAGDAAEQWQRIGPVVEAALEKVDKMRRQEGAAMAESLKANCQAVAAELDEIQVRAPRVVDNYRGRLEERLKNTLAEYEISLDAADVLREVNIFSDRCDISEEIVRLQSHLSQFHKTMELTENCGRKLEFITQEMFREANTIGSKANDAEISQRVIEVKTAIERIREMIQNVE